MKQPLTQMLMRYAEARQIATDMLPDFEIGTGYIGNTYNDGTDDRSFMVFLPNCRLYYRAGWDGTRAARSIQIPRDREVSHIGGCDFEELMDGKLAQQVVQFGRLVLPHCIDSTKLAPAIDTRPAVADALARTAERMGITLGEVAILVDHGCPDHRGPLSKPIQPGEAHAYGIFQGFYKETMTWQ